MTPCTSDKARLDPFADGTLPEPGRSEVAAHLLTCEECRREVGEIRALLVAARSLPREIRPRRELWGGIAERLGSPVTGTPAAYRGRPSHRLRIPLALAAALALMLAGGVMATWWQRRTAPSDFAQQRARYQEIAAGLASELARDTAGLPETTRQVVERNLRIIDAAISEAEQALTLDPGNADLAAMLLARYEQRVELLQRARRAGRQGS